MRGLLLLRTFLHIGLDEGGVHQDNAYNVGWGWTMGMGMGTHITGRGLAVKIRCYSR
jgi:hypothetical protein